MPELRLSTWQIRIYAGFLFGLFWGVCTVEIIFKKSLTFVGKKSNLFRMKLIPDCVKKIFQKHPDDKWVYYGVAKSNHGYDFAIYTNSYLEMAKARGYDALKNSVETILIDYNALMKNNKVVFI